MLAADAVPLGVLPPPSELVRILVRDRLEEAAKAQSKIGNNNNVDVQKPFPHLLEGHGPRLLRAWAKKADQTSPTAVLRKLLERAPETPTQYSLYASVARQTPYPATRYSPDLALLLRELITLWPEQQQQQQQSSPHTAELVVGPNMQGNVQRLRRRRVERQRPVPGSAGNAGNTSSVGRTRPEMPRAASARQAPPPAAVISSTPGKEATGGRVNLATMDDAAFEAEFGRDGRVAAGVRARQAADQEAMQKRERKKNHERLERMKEKVQEFRHMNDQVLKQSFWGNVLALFSARAIFCLRAIPNNSVPYK